MNSGLTIEELVERDNQILRARAANAPCNCGCAHRYSSGFTAESLKQAMDDAKEVRAQALRNARQALEEAFSKKFEDQFAQRIADYGNTSHT